MKAIKLLLVVLIACLFTASAFGERPIRIATTLSTYADIAKAIGGEAVDVSSVASPRFNPHFIEPRPSDVLKVKRADLFIHSGLDLEAWRDALMNAVARADMRVGGARQLDLSESVNLLEIPSGKLSRAAGDIHIFGNPHYWLDPRNALVISEKIEVKLSELDPSNALFYHKNSIEFRERLTQRISTWRSNTIKFRGQELLGYHNEWVYLMDFLGLEMKEFLEPKPGIPPTPKHMKHLNEYVQERKIHGIVSATFYPKEALEDLAKRSGAKIILLCQNVGELEQASDYIAMLDYNISQITQALQDG